MIQTDLENYIEEEHYPDAPGYKENTTSREAAESMKEDAETLRMAVYGALKHNGGMTADETAEYLNRSILSIRPRFTELKKQGLIFDTGFRRKNASGKKAKVWGVVR